MGLLKKTTGIIAIGAVAGMLFASGKIMETNDAGHYKIKQAMYTGEMTVFSAEGTFTQFFGDIHDYQLTGTYVDDVAVRFKDGSTAVVQSVVKYRLPGGKDERLRLHREMQSYTNVVNVLVPSAIQGTMKQTSNLFGAEEVYSTRRSEFVQMFSEQLTKGLYATKAGKATNEVIRNEDGTPQIAKSSVLSEYGIEIINVEINNIDFDTKTDDLIAARKDSEQKETLARAVAEQSKQDAISAVEKGKANVAKAKYASLVIKEQAVIEAEKKTAMSIEATKQANETALQVEAKGRAEAIKAKLLVEAGLSPKEQAEFDMKTSIGIAQALGGTDGIQFPAVMVFGSGTGEGGSPMNPFDAVGLKAFQDMARQATEKGAK